jgi:hypothetical protein
MIPFAATRAGRTPHAPLREIWIPISLTKSADRPIFDASELLPDAETAA